MLHCFRLRELLPHVTLVQVVHVLDDSSVEEARELGSLVDRLLLDSGNPRLTTKELGGTGRVHDWLLSAAIREQTTVPLLLAGGLRPDNVAAGIRAVRPFGVDVCTGVRVDGRLDAESLRRFVNAVRTTNGEPGG